MQKLIPIFSIYSSQKILDKYKLKDEYLKFFEKLNNLNINYASIFYYLEDINDIKNKKTKHYY